MSFKLGSFSTTTIPGLAAVLLELPAANPNVGLLDLPAHYGAELSSVGLNSARFIFNLSVTADNAYDAIKKADQVTAAMYPLRGLQTLEMDALPGWQWEAVQVRSLEWQRDPQLWPSAPQGVGTSVLRASAEFVAPDPHGHKDDVYLPYMDYNGRNFIADSYVRKYGNAPSRPSFRMRGQVSPQDVIRITMETALGQEQVSLSGPLESSETLILDFPSMEFYIQDGAGTRVRNVADRFYVFSAIESPAPTGATEHIAVETTGSITEFYLTINGKRI